MIYGVISEQNAPAHLIAQAQAVATTLAIKGAVMRTPYATIFDTEVYNAVKRWNVDLIERFDNYGMKPSADLMKHASRYRSNWSHLSEPAKIAHACLSATVVGRDAKSFADMIIGCWYIPGIVSNTVHAIATDYQIPVYNVAEAQQLAELWKVVIT